MVSVTWRKSATLDLRDPGVVRLVSIETDAPASQLRRGVLDAETLRSQML
jgi:hypothetical protein